MNDREVAEYLLANPEFFAEHAEMLATIRLANPHGKAAVSLQERQMEMLRDKNKHLERRLAELLRYGHENDSIASKFNRWTIRVMAERDPYALPRTIATGLRDIFDVPQAALRVWDVAEPYAQAEFARHVGEEVRIFANSLDHAVLRREHRLRGRAVAGAGGVGGRRRWRAAGSATSDSAHATESIALLALRDPEGNEEAPTFGLLVMGSADARRFHDGMATDFLTQIGALGQRGAEPSAAALKAASAANNPP